MSDCWAITQHKARRCGQCTGDCGFLAPDADILTRLRAAVGTPPVDLEEWDD